VSDRAALYRDPVRAEDRYSLGVLACRDGLWERDGTCWRRLRDWFNRFRRLKIRYKHRADIHLAFLQPGCALISLGFLS
jgi:hypothetical protein